MMSEFAPLVLDASAAIALIRSEPLAASIRALIDDQRAGAGRLLVPDHFWIELANVLTRRYGARSEQVVDALRTLDELEVESIHLDRPQLLLSLDVQSRAALSCYDAVYLALAESAGARLLTLDLRLADAAGDRAIRLDGLGPRRLAEESTGYGGAPVDWARFGPYLARLRAEARARVTEAPRG